MLGVMNEQGFGVERSAEEAVKWYRRAADQGMGSAAYNLSRFYQNGDGVERNLQEAVRYLTLAAEKGHGRAMGLIGGGLLYDWITSWVFLLSAVTITLAALVAFALPGTTDDPRRRFLRADSAELSGKEP